MSRSDLTLVEVPATPKLTELQRQALNFLLACGHDGVLPARLGAYMHFRAGKHFADQRCDFCARDGNRLLRALRRKGVARLRRVDGRTFWQATNLEPGTAVAGGVCGGGRAHGDAQRAPGSFGEFPEGF